MNRILLLGLGLWACISSTLLHGQTDDDAWVDGKQGKASPFSAAEDLKQFSWLELKRRGAESSSYIASKPVADVDPTKTPEPNLKDFRERVRPILESQCISCHEGKSAEGNIRIDELDPNLFEGQDTHWWLEVFAVLGKGEMPPPDAGVLSEAEKKTLVDWLSQELMVASQVRRSERGDSAFRRLTRYEYNYALQDLLGLPLNFAKDLPPEATSEDGFLNSSDMLHMSSMQFATYFTSARAALEQATVRGNPPPMLSWRISMAEASASAWEKQRSELEKLRASFQDKPEEWPQAQKNFEEKLQKVPGQAYYLDRQTKRTERIVWRYPGAKYAWSPHSDSPESSSEPLPVAEQVAVLPPRQKMVIELGDQIPDEGTLRLRVRACQLSQNEPAPSLQLEFGWQASNDSAASVRISEHDLRVTAEPGNPEFYQWEIPLSEVYPRNSVRGISKMGDLPSPSEFLKLVNSSVSHGSAVVDYIEVVAPVYKSWPPESHVRVLGTSTPAASDELKYARKILADFMPKAWRGEVTELELQRKLGLFERIRPECDDFQQAMVEVLATVLVSPRFLYVARASSFQENAISVEQYELATRLSLFLWCSLPDDELLNLAATKQLSDSKVLAQQVDRLLSDERSGRFVEQFVRQWLGLQLLDYLDVDRKAYPRFDPNLLEAMQQEPIEYFAELLRRNESVLNFLHSDFAMINERLAQHYGMKEVEGNDFRRVSVSETVRRGGLLTQAGLLAMNSDGKDSHPLKRGIWMLENLLNDTPPPPPPAVPEIDLADPEIAKLTLKERIEDHRNDPACISCHAKIDPWGIAFENYDAVGAWRTKANGREVDSTSQLFNGQELSGMDGLKRYLLAYRQDQFVRALVHKMATFALGRPMTFGDRAGVDEITSDLRTRGDGLRDLVHCVVLSELFRSK